MGATLRERSWQEISAAIREMLLTEGIPPQAVDWIIGDLEPRYLALP